MKSKLETLKSMLADKTFHHATIRTIGREQIWVYKVDKSENGFRGYSLAMSIPNNQYDKTDPKDPVFEMALKLLANTGISIGSYGRG